MVQFDVKYLMKKYNLIELFSLGSNKKLNQSYEIDLQNLIIQKTEEILQINLQQFPKVNDHFSINNFNRLLFLKI